MDEVKVIELFAGVGGFRIGLERADADFFKVVWANQWEPATKAQHAAMVYEKNFGKGSVSNVDINKVPIDEIPYHDMLVGGFPCQDYSVASTLSRSKGIEGKKGVLWWSIYNILKGKGEKRASILLLENVDRLLLSPASQRGRDFAIILECLNELGYLVEWRIINAADYGMPQKRRRTYIVAVKKDGKIGKKFSSPEEWIYQTGIFAKAFPLAQPEDNNKIAGIKLSEKEDDRLLDITRNFNAKKTYSPFEKAGVMINGIAYSTDYIPAYNGHYTTLGECMVRGSLRPDDIESFYIPAEDIERWRYFKGSKREERTKANGFKYYYTEGAMAFPDPLDGPSRTIITSEGGSGPDRCRHIIEDETGRLRRLTPIELERLNMFPDNHTQLEGVSNAKRAFLMGNALVCGIVTRIGQEMLNRLK
jgi:DNA (cytosine-5)-methyltransferase 1